MKLALVISSLAGGGAERVMATLANGWAQSGASVTLITLATSDNDKYSLDPRVHRVALGVTGQSSNLLAAIRNNLWRVLDLRRAIRGCGPDAVISFMDTTNVLSIIACTGMRMPVIASDHTNVSMSPPRGVWRWLYRCFYRRAAAVVALTQRGAEAVALLAGRPAEVIPNPVREVSGSMMATPETTLCGPGGSAPNNLHTLVAIGRLQKEKGFDLLIDAFARVAGSHPAWRLVILGEGTERENLTARIFRGGLNGRIELPGFVSAPETVLRQADIFVLSSRFEGLPMALLEAMTEGLACISFDCPTGPREIIEHGVNGWLVSPEDVGGLASAMSTLMDDAALRNRLGKHAKQVRDKYALPVILERWNGLLRTVGVGV